jgi:hypothetical protein
MVIPAVLCGQLVIQSKLNNVLFWCFFLQPRGGCLAGGKRGRSSCLIVSQKLAELNPSKATPLGLGLLFEMKTGKLT